MPEVDAELILTDEKHFYAICGGLRGTENEVT
jgi:hypothetical protein